MKKNDWIAILDFGSQYTQLIARRVRESRVYSSIHPFNITVDKIKSLSPSGIILSGGPSSVLDAASAASPTSRRRSAREKRVGRFP